MAIALAKCQVMPSQFRTDPDGGGWRIHGRGSDQHRATDRAKTTGARASYVYLHSAIDGYSRLAYTEHLPDEKASTAVAFWAGARAWFDPRHHHHHVLLLLRSLPRLRSAVLVTGSRWARAAVATPGSRDYRRSTLHIQSRFAVEDLDVIQGAAFTRACG